MGIHDHDVNVKTLAVTPQVGHAHLISSIGTAAHDHLAIQIGQILQCLVGILRVNDPGGTKTQHIHQRSDAPAVLHPQGKCSVIRRLHSPGDGTVAYLGSDKFLSLISLLYVFVELVFDLEKDRITATGRLIDTIPVQRQIGSDHLRIPGAVDLKPVQHILRLLVEHFHAPEKRIPVKGLTGVFFYKFNAVGDLLHRIRHDTVIGVADRHGQIIGRHTKILRLQTVAHQGSITGRITMNRAGTKLRIIILQRHAQFRQRHRAYVRRHAESLCRIRIMNHTVLHHHRAGIDRSHLHRGPDQIGKSIHDLAHHILIKQNHSAAELLVIAHMLIRTEHPGHTLAHILHYDPQCSMRNAKLCPAHSLGMPVKEVRNHQIIDHPAIAEKCLDIVWSERKSDQYLPGLQPLAIII